MNMFSGINKKALVIEAAISAAFIIFGYTQWDWFYPFAAAGFLYAGYGQNDIKTGTAMGTLSATPTAVLALQGYLGTFKEGFFTTETGIITVLLIVLAVGAFVGFVGGWAKRDRIKALEEYEKKQKIGKNKTREKKSKAKQQAAEKTTQKTGFLNKILKK